MKIVLSVLIALFLTLALAGVAHGDPAASPIENQRAQEHFNVNLETATRVGGLAGSAAGAAIGCAVAAAIGCVPGAIAGGALGGIVGTIVVGGPTLLVSGTDVVQTWLAPPGTTQWED